MDLPEPVAFALLVRAFSAQLAANLAVLQALLASEPSSNADDTQVARLRQGQQRLRDLLVTAQYRHCQELQRRGMATVPRDHLRRR
jgi:hypothetical protein